MEKKCQRSDSSLNVNMHFPLFFFNCSVLTAHVECLGSYFPTEGSPEGQKYMLLVLKSYDYKQRHSSLLCVIRFFLIHLFIPVLRF
jgi:hypothetical protein